MELRADRADVTEQLNHGVFAESSETAGCANGTILGDLERVHRDIRKCVSRIDIMRMGHAMARPKVGGIFSPERRKLAKPHGRVLFANSDLSGFSIFEEAQYRGIKAADALLGFIGTNGRTSAS